MKTFAIIDGDLLLHRAASAVQTDYDFGGGVFATGADFHRAADKVRMDIADYAAAVFATDIVVALSDPSGVYWRHQILPTYKHHRGKAKPVLFKQLREWVEREYRCVWHPGLEGDDACGVLSTHKRKLRGLRIIVGSDKDYLQVPGLLYRPHRPKEGVQEITLEAADRFHMEQTLTGDATDGYHGIPGIGPKKAAKILDAAPPPHTTHSSQCACTAWDKVVRAYQRAGRTEQDCLTQARVARILRAGEYHQRIGVRLWTPE